MSSPDRVPGAGYRLDKVSALELVYRVVPPEEVTVDAEQRETTLYWDWRITEDHAFEVFMRGRVAGNSSAFEEVEVSLLGEFSFKPSPSVSLDTFVRVHAPAILLPYIRETIGSLTGRGPFGAFHFPAINVVELGKSYDFAKSTGAAQLREDPALAERLGLSEMMLAISEAQG